MRNLIRRILREENEKTPKSKLLKMLNKPNGLVKLLTGGFTIEDISDIMEMSEKEIYQRFNPFEFIDEVDEEFKKSIEVTIREKIGNDGWIKRWKDSTEEEIFNFLINVGIDDNRYQLTNWDIGDWKIPKTDELLELIYGDWIKQHEGYKTLIRLIKSK
jgi:hypothetical protein